jgi:hypothetical protein
MTRLPSEEDLDRAKRKMAERDRHLTQVCENVKNRFLSNCPLHNVYILWQRDVDFRAYVFFNTDTDVVECKSNGTITAIESAVYEELERFGRGKRGEIVVAFEYDSNENVDRKYEGDYLLRLR